MVLYLGLNFKNQEINTRRVIQVFLTLSFHIFSSPNLVKIVTPGRGAIKVNVYPGEQYI